MTGIVLDTGALIGFERNDRRVVAILARALEHDDPVLVPAAVVAQAWRDGRTQARLARLLGSPACHVVTLDDHAARAAGQLCGARGTDDVVDASMVRLAQERSLGIVTSDPADLRRLDPHLRLVAL